MNKKNIFLVIILMTLALIGLISLQLFWVKNAIIIEENNFKRSVNDAMSIVITKLEKKEISEHFEKNREKIKLFYTIDSLNKLLIREQQKYPGIDKLASGYETNENKKSKIEITSWDLVDGEAILSHDTNLVYNEDQSGNYENTSKTGTEKLDIDKTILRDYNLIKSKRDQLLRKSALLEDIFGDVINMGNFKPIEKRIDPYLLDSLIYEELTNKNIKTEYEFGIYSPSRGQLIVQKTGKYKSELLKRNFTYVLFPSDIYMNPEYLVLYFPKERSYLLLQLLVLLIASILMIVIIIYSFGYTIFTIFRQKKLSEIKNDFVNNMTHEIKTPISTISLACEALTDKDIQKSTEMFENYVSMIKHENKRLESLVEHILQTATLERGQLVLNKELIDLHKIIEQAVNNVGFHVMQKSGVINQELNAAKHEIMADKVHITNLIYNLLDNANKYSPEKPKIIISTENTKLGVIIKVKDNGIGISKANQKKIFEKFSRVPTGNVHNVKGFGLGLSYVKAIVDKHQGYIKIESELKKGSVFIVFLPFK